MSEKSENLNFPIRGLQILAGTAGLIGAAVLVALLAQGSYAADGGTNPPGLSGGARPFGGNAFMGNPNTAPKPNYFPNDDEEDDDSDEFDFNPAQPPGGARPNVGFPSGAQGGPGAPMGGGAAYANENTQGGISLGGTGTGVISNNKQPALTIDSMSAEGSKVVVTDFNFPDADILDIAKTLGKLTGKNFILDKDVKGKITIVSNSPITVGDAWKAFLTALDMTGFALIPSGSYLRIARQRDARDKQLKTYVGDYSPDTDALITRVFPLKYLSAEEVARNFRSFMPANSRIIPYEQTNTVIVTDTGSNIAKLSKLLEILDVEGYDAGIGVIPVKYASAAELAKLIDTLLPGTSPVGTAPGAPRFGVGAGSRFNARRTKEGGIINTIIADERTNTLIVHANSKGEEQVRELVAKLDQKLPAATGGGKVHVVYLQFADAEQISNTLNNLGQTSTATAPHPIMPGGTGVNPVQASLFEGTIRVAPDKATNSLVITASPSDFSTVQRVINRLDIPRDQVFAQIVIMEVTLGRNFQFSTNVINPVNGIGFTPNTDLFDFISNPLSAKGAILGFKAGRTQNYPIGGQSVAISNIQGLIKAIQTRSNANVLATPQILALDNTEANFESAEKIPVPQTTAVQGAGVATSFTKENVSLSITLKPQINKVTNFVKLDIQTKLENINRQDVPEAIKAQAFATTSRTTKTSIVVGDKDTVVLGGLTRDVQNETVSKIPILGDIPLLGWLFSAKTSDVTKTNLLVFITPTIIRQYESVRAVLDKKLKERDDFIESTAGGEDPMRVYRDNMIRSLPNVEDINKNPPQRSYTIGEEGDEPAAKPVDRGGNMNVPNQPRSSGSGPVIPNSQLNPEIQAPSAPESNMNPAPAPSLAPAPEGNAKNTTGGAPSL